MSGDGVIDEIKQRLDIAEVVGDYLQLKRAGTSLRACCPFHDEKTASFFVNPERQIYHCFGCGEGGDIFEFIQKMEGLEFPDALRLLAGKAGVKLQPGRGDDGQRSERRRLLEANALAAKLYHKLLLEDERASVAREYVERRALSASTVEDFLLGYSPDSWDATSKFLMSRGFSESELFRAGLSVKSDRGSGHYDRFRGRMMFPIRDVHGEVIGFTARVIPGADGRDPEGPKYVNTPQTVIYDKSRALYGINLAKQHIRREGLAVVVEGNMDVVSSHQAGVKNVVASSGTALTSEQLELFRRFTDRLVLSFDADSAGESAAKRGIDAVVAAGFSIRMLRLPPNAGKDPDDCVRKDVELWKRAIVDAEPYMSWYLNLASERTDFSNAESKRRAAAELLQEIAKIPNQVEQSHWISQMARMFSTPEVMLFEQLRRLGRSTSTRSQVQPSIATPVVLPARKERLDICTEYLLGLALVWPSLSKTVVGGLSGSELPVGLAELYSNYREFYTSIRSDGEKVPIFRSWLASRDKSVIARQAAILELQAEQEFGELPLESLQEETGKLIGEFKSLQISHRRQELVRAMSVAEKNGDLEKIKEIQRELGEMTA
ncbi:DNA primase [Candidatus Uhrbacteria bacterium RIFOXYC2_FULL_47_19]|uniref:DNA primase n=1 Tax=Candidatus Uhrbacteria bacterium RIFOXYC2_FULL_47_19 TaxID=1802424 RepID=A0A1F7WF83_9BACT|nr:MAG: DNA primase [Candidatus Uhrbacteria bacterium RIFOXYC2_FULL_47_19]HCC22169.1 DNA primase [Candidatus Uhrbacteria bacterium]